MSIPYFSHLDRAYEAFRGALFALYLAETADAPQERLATLRAAARAQLADLHTILESSKREYGLLETAESEHQE